MKDLKHASTRGVAWNLVQNVISRLLGVVVISIIARVLDHSDFGAVALALAITTFAELLVNQGYGEFITQSPSLTDEHLDTCFWFNGLLGLALTGAIVLAAEPLAAQFAEPSVAPIIRWLSLTIVFRSFSIVPTGLLVREMKFRSLSLRGLAAAAIGGVVGIGCAVAGLGIYSLVIQLLIADLASNAILWGATPWRPGRKVSRKCIRDLSSFGAPVFGATVLQFVSRRLDTVIVLAALGLTKLGIYSMGQRVFQIANQIVNRSTDSVAFSALAKLADSEERRRQAFYKVLELTAVLCFPAYAGLAIVAEPLTLTLFGDKWIDSAPVLTAFAISGIPFSLTYLHVAAIKSVARTRYLLAIQVVLLAIYLPSMFVAVNHGATWAAVAYLISCVAIFPVEVLCMRAAMSVEVADYLRALWGPTIATIVMAGATCAVALASESLVPVAQVGIEMVTGAVTYFAALRWLAPATYKRCRDLVNSTFRRRRQE